MEHRKALEAALSDLSSSGFAPSPGQKLVSALLTSRLQLRLVWSRLMVELFKAPGCAFTLKISTSVFVCSLFAVSVLKSRWLDVPGYFPADCSRGRARDLQAVASDGHRKTIFHVQALFAVPLPPVSMRNALPQPTAPTTWSLGTYSLSSLGPGVQIPAKL